MEYTKLVERILEAEKTAKQMAREATEQSEQQEKALSSEIERIKEQHMNQVRVKLFELERQTKEQTAAVMTAMDTKYAAALFNLESAAQNNHDAWVDELFQTVIGHHT